MRGIGILWENAASKHLQRAGLALLETNFTCRVGEIDLIMLDKNAGYCVVFVEVRYRVSEAHGDGIASIGAAKRKKITRAAALYLQARPQLAGATCRFDIVACTGTPAQPQFDWIRSAFDAA
jgi:putative endonuclease